ncbi:AMP-binding-domain-containing protein, partial [Glonium stellatum]
CSIRLHIKSFKGGVSVFLDFWSSELSTDQVKNVASTFDTIFTNVIHYPNTTVENLSYFSTRNKSQIEKWNATPLEKVERTIHGIFEDSVIANSASEAVCAWDGSLSYLELDEYASRIALHLNKLGVGPEVFVPLCFPKSKWNVVAMVAVLKAGGAFVPLDPSYPLDRLQSLASSVQAKIVLCSKESADLLVPVADTVIPITAEFVEQLPLDTHQLIRDVASHNAAYIIPTSGSTGTPKLTLVEHGSYCSGVKAHAPGMLMDSTDPLRVLQFASHTFDASLVEILSPLMLGGTVCIPDEETRLNNIAKAIDGMNVTWTCLTPTFVRFLEPSMVPRLATIALVGEAMSQSNLETWSKAQNLVNAYGPSECSVAAVTNPHVTSETDPKNIGYPVGIHAWVVDPDDYNKLVPVGCVGELLAEGNTLARCYFNDDQKTAQAFIRNPKWAEGRSFRGYLTGDLVRQNSDGSLNFVGRKDTQVVSAFLTASTFGL